MGGRQEGKTGATNPGSSIRRPRRVVMARDRRGIKPEQGRLLELEKNGHLWKARACMALPEHQVAASMEAVHTDRAGWMVLSL